jgi:hypothetical protein
MLFSDLYKGSRHPFTAKLRRSTPQPLVITTPDYDADLVSKDKAKQKDAVKRYLAEKIRNDWAFQWPPPAVDVVVADSAQDVALVKDDAAPLASQPAVEVTGLVTPPAETGNDPVSEGDADSEDGDDGASEYSTVSEDASHFKPRLEWTSDLSDDDAPISHSPFRFDSPDSVGTTVKASVLAKRARRRKALRDEIAWNEGLACFEARRNAWTGARTVRVRPKPSSPSTPLSALSPKRLFHRNSVPPTPSTLPTSPLSPTQSIAQRLSADGSTAAGSDSSEPSKDGLKDMSKQATKDSARSAASQPTYLLPVETIIPIPPPLLPPTNSMRSSITPAVYLSIYDKVVANALTPSCPINLSDMIRSCVAGWKRDGEWPPKSAPLDARRQRRVQSGSTNVQLLVLTTLNPEMGLMEH